MRLEGWRRRTISRSSFEPPISVVLLEFCTPVVSLVPAQRLCRFRWRSRASSRGVSKDEAGTGMAEGAWLYILRCSDGSYYVGTTRTSLEIRIAQHSDGTFQGYTASRRPVELIFAQWFDQITDAIENERRLKGWSRAKKEALIRGDFASLQQLAKRKRRSPGAGSSE